MIPGERLHAARIAVVDDEPANVRVLERFLGLAGFRDVRTWTFPREALEAIEHDGADLLLLDLLMPGIDGYSILERLRASDAEGPRMPVVVLTADATRDARERALGLGATDFLTKPFDPTEIGLRIRNILVTHFLEQDLLLEKASLEGQVRERTAALRESLDRQRVLGEQRERLLRRLVTAQEEERRRIAADIHDDTIQTMAALAIRLELARRKAETPQLQAELDLAVETARAATKGLRELLFKLHPASLDRDGLVAALRGELDRARESDDQAGTVFELIGTLDAEPPIEPRTTVFRIVQEALTNVRRHAEASHVRVDVESADGGIRARVVDDGKGMNADLVRRPRPGHLGLVSMRERAELAGGTWRLQSTPGTGTTIDVWIPVGSGPRPDLDALAGADDSGAAGADDSGVAAP
jgi:signal transduction histidine kinase